MENIGRIVPEDNIFFPWDKILETVIANILLLNKKCILARIRHQIYSIASPARKRGEVPGKIVKIHFRDQEDQE